MALENRRASYNDVDADLLKSASAIARAMKEGKMEPKIVEEEEMSPRMREDAERYSYDHTKKGTVCFEACPCCGSVQWVTSSKEPEDVLRVSVSEAFDTEHCRPCNFMLQRHPEIFQWVLNVASYQRERAQRRHEPR